MTRGRFKNSARLIDVGGTDLLQPHLGLYLVPSCGEAAKRIDHLLVLPGDIHVGLFAGGQLDRGPSEDRSQNPNLGTLQSEDELRMS